MRPRKKFTTFSFRIQNCWFSFDESIFIWFIKFRIRASWFQVAPASTASSPRMQTNIRSRQNRFGSHTQTHSRSSQIRFGSHTQTHSKWNQNRFGVHTHTRYRPNPSQHTLLASLDLHTHASSRSVPRSLAIVTVTASLGTGHVTTFYDGKTSVQHSSHL